MGVFIKLKFFFNNGKVPSFLKYIFIFSISFIVISYQNTPWYIICKNFVYTYMRTCAYLYLLNSCETIKYSYNFIE